MRPRRLGRRSLPPPPLRLPELPPALHFSKPTPDSPAAQPVNHAPGSRSPRGAQVSWAQVSPFFQRRTPRPINREAGPQNATRGPGSKGGGSLLSPPFLQTWLPRSLFQNLAAQASAAPRKSRDRFPVFLWGAGFMGAGLPPRPSAFRRNLLNPQRRERVERELTYLGVKASIYCSALWEQSRSLGIVTPPA